MSTKSKGARELLCLLGHYQMLQHPHPQQFHAFCTSCDMFIYCIAIIEQSVSSTWSGCDGYYISLRFHVTVDDTNIILVPVCSIRCRLISTQENEASVLSAEDNSASTRSSGLTLTEWDYN